MEADEKRDSQDFPIASWAYRLKGTRLQELDLSCGQLDD
jgi:hypothetical protein